jgi:formylglycine-generating enzyme required for sulfatase activity
VVDATKAGARRMTPERFGQGRGELILARNPQARTPAPDPKELLGADLLADLASQNHRTRIGAVGELVNLMQQPPLRSAVIAVLAERLPRERDFQVRGLIETALKSAAQAREAPPPASSEPAPAAAAPVPLSTFTDTLKDGSAGPTMVRIPAGTFLMGSPDSEPERSTDEQQHSVTIKPFAIGKYEVSFAEYDRFAKETGRTPPEDRGWGRGDRPVINVSWDDATAYAAWLAEQTGRPYRLPTEAEWEYAARAGTDSPFWTGACIHTDQANYNGNRDYNGCGAKTGVYRQQTLPVDSLAANPWGLHHVAGNVWEWTCSAYANPYDGNEMKCISKNNANAWTNRAIRGGALNYQPSRLRSAYRFGLGPSFWNADLGFRLAQDL